MLGAREKGGQMGWSGEAVELGEGGFLHLQERPGGSSSIMGRPTRANNGS